MKLAGTLLAYNANKYDYCYKEAIECLFEFCDYVIVAAGGDDNTLEDVTQIDIANTGKMHVLGISEQLWNSQHGFQKLNFFTNLAIDEAEQLGYEYQFNLQADEIVHEKSYEFIRKAIETNEEGFVNTRVNLWKTPYLKIDVEGKRNPCSYNVIRLAKIKYSSCGDAESIDVSNPNIDYLDSIKIYHMGFVRKKEIMKAKIINMQENIFGIDHDPKLDKCEIFNPDLWFDPKTDLKPIDEPLPKIIAKWAKERYISNNFEI